MDTHITALVLISLFVLGCVGFKSPFLSDEPEKSVKPGQTCGQCNESSCPILAYCVAVVVKDHCGCCKICSTDLYQGKMRQDSPAVEDSPCSSVSCPKYKVCMENMQGLPLCSCPSIYSCRRKKKEVCGTDNLTYHSRCHLRIAACNMGKRLKVRHKQPCSPEELAAGEVFPKKRKQKNKRKRKRKNRNKSKAGKNSIKTELKKKEDRQRGVSDVTSNKRDNKKSRRRQKRRQRNSRRKRMQYKSRKVSRKYQLLPYRF